MNDSAPTIIFYLLSAVVLGTAALAATRRQPVQAVLCLISCFIGVAGIYFLLGAPLLAAFQVILYAGAIIVLFLFVLMVFRDKATRSAGNGRSLTFILCLLSAAVTVFLIAVHPEGAVKLQTARVEPRDFGIHLFRRYWFAVELASFLLFVSLVGALHLGRPEKKRPCREGPS